MTTRPHFDTTIDELERLVHENLHNIQVLGELRQELTFRTTERAKLLMRQIEAVVAGLLPVPPKPPAPERPDDQQELL